MNWSRFKDKSFVPAVVFFIAIWLVSAGYLVSNGQSSRVWYHFKIDILVMFLCGITVFMTKSESDEELTDEPPEIFLHPMLQLVAVLAFIVITGYTALMVHEVIATKPISNWSTFVNAFGRLGDKVFHPAIVENPSASMVNIAQYMILPLLLLIVFGVHLKELGFCKGNHSKYVILLWCFLPIVYFAGCILRRQMLLYTLGKRLVSNFLQKGIGQEFLFRGALQTRLGLQFSVSWSIVIQGIIFGLWHFGANYQSFGYNGVLSVLALSIISQGTLGLAYGIIFHRTKNLLAGTVIHTVVNSTGF